MYNSAQSVVAAHPRNSRWRDDESSTAGRSEGKGESMEPETINSTELRTKTRDLMERVKYNGEIFLVETFGRPMAVIMSVEDFDAFRKYLSLAKSVSSNQTKTKKPNVANRTKSTKPKAEIVLNASISNQLIGKDKS
ncbi:type II toxin-antitoxin system Phd/YefM family antitoxin [Anaerolineae bacterium CFX7]|nr:type II toxin-antitoxin system Phd/YefM family antitoxin [Anaerolineae bacterium CFX7]